MPKNEIFHKIKELLIQKNAAIISHYYVDASIQALAEETGGVIADSLDMARFAMKSNAEILIVAGVHFMGETVKILNPHKKVLMPTLEATCSLVLSCPPEKFAFFKSLYPEYTTVVYANCAVVARLYANQVVILAESKVIGEHHRYFGRDHIAYNPWHYVSLLERKPGALRNGAPFQEFGLPEGIEAIRHKLIKKRGGDKEFVKILQAIPIYGVEEVATACDLALEDGIIQGDYVLNVIGRLRPGILEVKIPVYYTLREEPWSDCGRYNGLLGGNHA